MLNDGWTIRPSSCALIIVDVQNDYAHKDGHMGKTLGDRIEERRKILKPLRRMIDVCREGGVRVIWIQSVRTPEDSERHRHRIIPPRLADDPEWLGGPRKDSWGATIVEEVKPGAADTVVQKTRNSAFYKTDLENLLKREGIDTLMFAGIATNICVESSLRDAYFRDFDVILVEDCCSAGDTESHEATKRTVGRAYGAVTSSEEAIHKISDAVKARIRP